MIRAALLLLVIAAAAAGAQAPAGDSMYALPWVRDSLGPWRSDSARVWCVTRHADFGSLFVIASVVRADTDSACARPDGGFYPLLVDLPECPSSLVPKSSPFILVRCEPGSWYRFPARDGRWRSS